MAHYHERSRPDFDPLKAESTEKAVAIKESGGWTVVLGDERKEEYVKMKNVPILDTREYR